MKITTTITRITIGVAAAAAMICLPLTANAAAPAAGAAPTFVPVATERGHRLTGAVLAVMMIVNLALAGLMWKSLDTTRELVTHDVNRAPLSSSDPLASCWKPLSAMLARDMAPRARSRPASRGAVIGERIWGAVLVPKSRDSQNVPPFPE